jgi:mannitol/fructose-specific phosphotransferase system IIA component (Ntr-type)
MLLHHARTESVTALILAAGRRDGGLISSGPGNQARLVFVAIIPEAMNNEYLRILGAIARVCREEDHLKALLEAGDQNQFLSQLEQGCRQ